MFAAECDYYRASSTEEAIALLTEHPDAKLLAGGHSLIPMMKLRLAQPSALIDVGRLAELRDISVGDGVLRVGSLATHRAIHESEAVQGHAKLLSTAAGKIGDPQVRNKGTIGGNIAHADPASDLPAVLVALQATVHMLGPSGERSVPASAFFRGLLDADLAADEIVTHVTLPASAAGSAYLKVEHPASGYAVCGAAATMLLEGDVCSAVSLCFNGIASTPVVADVSSLVGSQPTDEAIDQAVAAAVVVEDPLGDVHASGEYRMVLAVAYGKRALKAARGA